MEGTLRLFKNRDTMWDYIKTHYDSNDFLMTKRNTPYGKCFGYISDYTDDIVGFASVSVDDNNEMHIYTFEISDEYKGEGYGRDFYEDLIEFFEPDSITLDPLDDDAESFWKHMGFQWDKDHEQMFKLL